MGAAVALAQYQRGGQTYGRQQHGGLTRQHTRTHRDNMFGRFGGHTDVNRRDERYGRNTRVGRYGGYTRDYNSQTGRFAGRRDPFRRNIRGNGRGYNPYRNHRSTRGRGRFARRTGNRNGVTGSDRLGTVCSKLTAQTAERECSTYTGREGCAATCARLRDSAGNYNRFQRRGRYSRFGRRGRTTTRRQQYNPYARRGRTQTRYNPYQRRTTRGRTGIFGRRTTRGRRQIRIPTQGGVFGRRTRRTTRGRGRNGILGNRLGQMGRNRRQHHL